MRNILLAILSLVFGATADAQSLKELLLVMPAEVCPLLSEYNKLELVDNQKNGKPMQTTNVMNKVSEMAQLTDTYARLKTTKNSEKTFKLLATSEGETLIAVVSTVYIDEQPDSHIDFYSLAWENVGADGRIDFDQGEGFHYMDMKADSDEMRLIMGNPLAIALDGSGKVAKPKAETVMLKWNGARFER